MAKILVVDDYEDNLKIVSRVLEQDQHDITTATSKEAIEKAKFELPDIILLDIQIPQVNGFDVCRQLKAEPTTANIPLIILTAEFKDSKSVLKGLDIVEDYIFKPFSSSELQTRIRVMIRLKNQVDALTRKNIELAELNQTLEQNNLELLSAQEALKEIAITDSLTKLYNRRYFESRLGEEFMRTLRNQQPIGIVVLDIDHFKQVNDTYGHPCGDSVLIQYANILKKNVRQHDIVARYGGEEFIIGLIGQTMEEAYTTGERIRVDVENFIFKHENLELKITCSAGIASYPEVSEDNPSLGELLKEGDAALYQAKREGRNRIVRAPWTPEPPPPHQQ